MYRHHCSPKAGIKRALLYPKPDHVPFGHKKNSKKNWFASGYRELKDIEEDDLQLVLIIGQSLAEVYCIQGLL